MWEVWEVWVKKHIKLLLRVHARIGSTFSPTSWADFDYSETGRVWVETTTDTHETKQAIHENE